MDYASQKIKTNRKISPSQSECHPSQLANSQKVQRLAFVAAAPKFARRPMGVFFAKQLPGRLRHKDNRRRRRLRDSGPDGFWRSSCPLRGLLGPDWHAWEKAAVFNPDGVFVQSDQIINALHAVLSELGIRPEHDLKIVSCNAEKLFLGPLDPRPASIDIHSSEIGRKAIDFLIARIENRTNPPSSLVLRPKLPPGEALSPSSGNRATPPKR